MHRFKIEQGNQTYKIDIENYKFLIGKNFNKKFDIYYLFKNYFCKVNNSECAVEECNKRACYFDDKPINLKLWKYFEVSPFFDLESDLKMGTKSLLLKYLDSFAEEFEYNEFFNTLTTLISSLNEDYLHKETTIEFGNKTVTMHLGEISRNIIFKEVIPLITEENKSCNSGDLNYEELIILQLKIIEKIASKTKDHFMFINANIPFITPKILLEIFGFNYDNCFLIINTDCIPNVNFTDVLLCGKYFIDFANDENILDCIMEFPFHIEKNDFIFTVQGFLSKDNTEMLNKNIIELFDL